MDAAAAATKFVAREKDGRTLALVKSWRGGKAGKLICAFFAIFFVVVVRDEACEPEKNGQST